MWFSNIKTEKRKSLYVVKKNIYIIKIVYEMNKIMQTLNNFKCFIKVFAQCEKTLCNATS